MALLYCTRVSTCVTMAEALAEASHACLTRLLNGRWAGPIRLDLAWRTLCTVAGGSLIRDETVVAKPQARLLGEAAWGWSSTDKKVVCGVSLVLLVWTAGESRLPVAYRVWHKGGLSKVALALALLRQARNRRKCQPQVVLCDSWDPAQRLRKRLRDSGWYCVCQVQKPRTFDGGALSASRPQPYGHAVGEVAGGLQGLVVQHRRPYQGTTRVSLTAPEGRSHSNKRHAVEEVLRVRKSQRSLEACPGGSRRPGGQATLSQPTAQEHHMALCLVAYLLVERERLEQGVTWRKWQQRLILKGPQRVLPTLERVRKAA